MTCRWPSTPAPAALACTMARIRPRNSSRSSPLHRGFRAASACLAQRARLMSDTDIFICEAADLEEGGRGVRFPVTAGFEDRTGFVVRYGGSVRGFLNRCAHVPIEL